MSRQTRILLSVLAGAIGLCLCAGACSWLGLRLALHSLGEAIMVTDPDEMARLAAEIADYDLPPGYREEQVLRILAFRFLLIAPVRTANESITRPVYGLMQWPSAMAGLNETEAQEQAQSGIERGLGRQGYDLEWVGRSEATIRGEPVAFDIYEGYSDDGEAVRELVSSVFAGESGPMVIMVMGMQDGWDQKEIDAFLASIQ